MEPLKEGEIICPECNGTGDSKPGERPGTIASCKNAEDLEN